MCDVNMFPDIQKSGFCDALGPDKKKVGSLTRHRNVLLSLRASRLRNYETLETKND